MCDTNNAIFFTFINLLKEIYKYILILNWIIYFEFYYIFFCYLLLLSVLQSLYIFLIVIFYWIFNTYSAKYMEKNIHIIVDNCMFNYNYFDFNFNYYTRNHINNDLFFVLLQVSVHTVLSHQSDTPWVS